MTGSLEEINQTISALKDVDVKVTYVLGLMVRENRISIEEKAFVKQGLLNRDPSFDMLVQLVSMKDDYTLISQYIRMFLESRKNEFSQEVVEDLSPETIKLIENKTEDSSPNDKLMIHRKIKQQMSNSGSIQFDLLGKIN